MRKDQNCAIHLTTFFLAVFLALWKYTEKHAASPRLYTEITGSRLHRKELLSF